MNQKVVDAYCVAFAELLKSVEEDSAVLKTVAGYDFPQTKELTKYDKEQGPSETGAALIRMLFQVSPSNCISISSARCLV